MPDPDQRAATRMQKTAQRRMTSSAQQSLAKPKLLPSAGITQPPASLIPTQTQDNPLLNAPKRVQSTPPKDYQKFLMNWLKTAKNVPYSKA
jgi:hypothetical protein